MSDCWYGEVTIQELQYHSDGHLMSRVTYLTDLDPHNEADDIEWHRVLQETYDEALKEMSDAALDLGKQLTHIFHRVLHQHPSNELANALLVNEFVEMNDRYPDPESKIVRVIVMVGSPLASIN